MEPRASFVVCLLIGCSPAHPDALVPVHAPLVPPITPLVASCADRAAELGRWLHTASEETNFIVSKAMHPVELVDRPALSIEAVPLWIGRDTARLGLAEGTLDDIQAHLTSNKFGFGESLAVIVDRDVPLRRLASFVEMAGDAGMVQLGFVFSTPRTAAEPKPDPVSAELASHPDHLVEIVRRVYTPCPALIEMTKRIAQANPSEVRSILVEGVTPALLECSCAPDLDALRTVLWVLVGGGSGVPATVEDFEIVPGADRGAVALSGATWNDVAPTLVAATQHVRLGRIVMQRVQPASLDETAGDMSSRRPSGDLSQELDDVKKDDAGCTGADCAEGPKQVKVRQGDPTGDLRQLTTSEIKRVVGTRARMWRACYQHELQRAPDLAGDLVVVLKVGPDGSVQSASIGKRSTLHDAAVESCVTHNMMHLKLPAKGVGASIEYPLAFSHER